MAEPHDGIQDQDSSENGPVRRVEAPDPDVAEHASVVATSKIEERSSDRMEAVEAAVVSSTPSSVLTPAPALGQPSPAPAAATASPQTIRQPAPRAAVAAAMPAVPAPRAVKSGTPTGAASAQAGRNQTDGSILGLGLGRLRIALDGKKERVTQRASETISGRVEGSASAHVVVRIGDTVREVTLDAGAFSTSVSLQHGRNEVRVLATDARGLTAEDTIVVQHVPPPATDGIAITSPRDGDVLSADAPPVVLIEGTVEDPALAGVRIVVNGHAVPADVVGGRFSEPVPVLAQVLRVHVEAGADGGERRSRAVTLRAEAAPLSGAVLVLDQGVTGMRDAAVEVTWRSNPSRVDARPQPVALSSLAASARPAHVFYLPKPAPGVYTFSVTADSATARAIAGTLYVPEGGALQPRPLRATPGSSGATVIARVLLPHGVLWEQDDWFTGQSATSETITKFRFPEGVSWTERKSALMR